MTNQQDPVYAMVARIDERTERIERDVSEIKSGNSPSCVKHAGEIKAIWSNIKGLWGLVALVGTSLVAGIVKLFFGGNT